MDANPASSCPLSVRAGYRGTRRTHYKVMARRLAQDCFEHFGSFVDKQSVPIYGVSSREVALGAYAPRQQSNASISKDFELFKSKG